MGTDPVLLLVPNWPEGQIAFLNPKGFLRFRQLDVGFPQLLVSPIENIASQEIGTFADFLPTSPFLDFVPGNLRRSFGILGDLHIKQSRRAAILAQEFSYTLGDLDWVLLSLSAAFAKLGQTFLDSFFKALVHGLFLEPPITAAAQDKRFLSTSRTRTQFDLQAIVNGSPIRGQQLFFEPF